MTATPAELVPEPEPYAHGGPSMLVDLCHRHRRTLDRDGTERLERAVANTLSSDVAGLVGARPAPAWVLDAIARRTVAERASLEAVQTAPLAAGSVPWVPAVPKPLTAGVQAAEKTELVSQKVQVPGAPSTPATIGIAADLSWLVAQEAGDAIFALLGEAVIRAELVYIVAQLQTGAMVGTSLANAISALEVNGQTPGYMLASHTAWAKVVEANPTGPRSFAGLPVLFAPTGNLVYVVAAGAVWCAISPTVQWQVSEPALGGVEVAAFGAVVCDPMANAVCTFDTAGA